MPPIGRRKRASNPQPAESDALPDGALTDTELDALASHGLAAHAIVDGRGTPTMRRLIDLLLFEIGNEIGGRTDRRRASGLN